MLCQNCSFSPLSLEAVVYAAHRYFRLVDFVASFSPLSLEAVVYAPRVLVFQSRVMQVSVLYRSRLWFTRVPDAIYTQYSLTVNLLACVSDATPAYTISRFANQIPRRFATDLREP
jgi:hypothetical protein